MQNIQHFRGPSSGKLSWQRLLVHEKPALLSANLHCRYPVAVATALKPDKPTAVRLLGDALVLWKDGTGEWHCWRDRCPHRLAPLSEGRVEDGVSRRFFYSA